MMIKDYAALCNLLHMGNMSKIFLKMVNFRE